MIDLTAGVDATTGAPFVLVELNDVPVGAERVTVWRTSAGRRFRVRGLVNEVADGAAARDYEAPIGYEASYRAEFYDDEGAFIEWSDSSVITLPASELAWLHNALDPATAVGVRMRDSAARAMVRPLRTQVFQPRGRSTPVVLFGTRAGLSGLALDCFTDTFAQAAALDALWGGYDDSTVPVVCVRVPPAMRLSGTLFMLIPEPQHVPLGPEYGAEAAEWFLVGDEVAPPAEALVVAALDYAAFTAFYEDYEAFTSAYADYTEASRDYSVAEP